MHGNPVGWFEIYVQEMERAKAFYQAVFEVELQKLASGDLEMWAFPADMSRYGAGGALVKMAGCPSGFAGSLVYFSSADCAVEEARAAAHGGTIQRPKMSIGQYGFISLVVDPEGNLIGLHSMS